MEKNTIYYILGALAVVYILISRTNKKKSKSRQGRKFMNNYKRKDKEEK